MKATFQKTAAMVFGAAPAAVFLLMKFYTIRTEALKEQLPIYWQYFICFAIAGLVIGVALYLSAKVERRLRILISALWCGLIAAIYITYFLGLYSFEVFYYNFMRFEVFFALFGAYLGVLLISLFDHNPKRNGGKN